MKNKKHKSPQNMMQLPVRTHVPPVLLLKWIIDGMYRQWEEGCFLRYSRDISAQSFKKHEVEWRSTDVQIAKVRSKRLSPHHHFALTCYLLNFS